MAGPNIILINCDDLGYGDLGCYGSALNDTPALDRLAAEGLRFTDFYAASPVCSPSRGALMTGCYPPRIGFGSFEGRWVLFPGQGVGLNPAETTLAGALRQAGYATQIVGKWHCGDQPEFLPTRHGFDHYYGLPYSNDMGTQVPEKGGERPPLPLLRDESVIQQQPDQAGLTERYVEESVRFIREHAGKRPFFLYFAHMYVHLPIYAQERFMKASRNGRYGAGVACIDWATSVLTAELARLGLDDNTLVIFTSDNGSRARPGEGGSNAPLRGAKGSTWEGGQRVACLMRWPGRIPAGSVTAALASNMDLFPTLVRLGGGAVSPDGRIDGVDLGPVLQSGGRAPSPRADFFYYIRNGLEAVRDGRWKLHVRKKDQALRELYDLETDPGETRNVIDAHPDIEAALLAKLAACREDLGDEIAGVQGRNVRPIGRVENPRPLTQFDPRHPYYMAAYDLPERG